MHFLFFDLYVEIIVFQITSVETFVIEVFFICLCMRIESIILQNMEYEKFYQRNNNTTVHIE